MENTEFKAKFDNIQRLFDRCISHAYETLERNIYMKSQYLNTEQVEELEGKEYIHNADELASLYMSYSVLSGKSSVRCPLKPSDSIPLCPNNPAH